MMVDLLIIGAGPAGITAGIYAARAGIQALVVERLFAGGQVARTHLLENYPGFPKGISGLDFSFALSEQAQHLGVDIVQEEIMRLELAGAVKTAYTQKDAYCAHAVILAMGAKPRTLGLPSEARLTGAGVSYCATCDGAFYKGKDVAVIGGGDTAGEDALYLSKIARSVTIMHRRNEFRMQMNLQERVRGTGNIRLMLEYVPVDVTGGNLVEGLRARHVRTGSTTQIALQGVFVAVGIEPETGLLKDGPVLDGGYVLADEYRQTSIPGVFAAGDIVKKPLRQVVTAVADGAVAVYGVQRYLMEKGV